ncbi:hypothetical protein ACIBSV_12290 [Embleya sp. NPDC050154]|uniref:hypothetical protein n=1 Tax=Embleya sp. NPDC050154 TaxID=3363988 RepID=UPI0037A88B82
MTTTPPQQPEGALIESALSAVAPRRSVRKAAELAGMSEARWRQIVKGYSSPKTGMHIPVRAPAETLARMAHAAEVTADQLRKVDREDAAVEMERLLGHGEDAPLEVRHLSDEPGWRHLQGVVEEMPPEMRATALRLAAAAIEAAKAERLLVPSASPNEGIDSSE